MFRKKEAEMRCCTTGMIQGTIFRQAVNKIHTNMLFIISINK